MHLLIQAYPAPDEETIREVRALEAICEAQDQLGGALFIDPSLNISSAIPCLYTLRERGELLSAVTLFAPMQAEAELTGITHPLFRRRGYMRALVNAAAEAARAFSITDLVFVCNPKSQSGVQAANALGGAYDFSEYRLRYDPAQQRSTPIIPAGLTLRAANETDLDDMTAISSASFDETPDQARHFIECSLNAVNRTQYVALLHGEPVGIGAIGYESGEYTLFGLGVLPQFQGRGIGRGIIACMLERLINDCAQNILIEVDSANNRALHLYQSCGFCIESSYDYYRTPVSHLSTQA